MYDVNAWIRLCALDAIPDEPIFYAARVKLFYGEVDARVFIISWP